MNYNNLTNAGKWFSSITTAQKEHIGRKILESRDKNTNIDKSEIAKELYNYPRCTTLFMSLPEKQQLAIMSHCRGKHDFKEIDEFDGWMFSE